MRSAVDFLPSTSTLLMSWVTSGEPYTGSETSGRLGAGPLRGILLLLHLCAVAAAGLLTVLHTLGIEGATDDLVADTREVLHATTANEHNGVLLQVVANTGDVGGNFHAAVEAHTCHLTQSRVRLLRGGGVDAGANTAAHGAALKRGSLGLRDLRRAALTDQLVNLRHSRVLRFIRNGRWRPLSCRCAPPLEL